MLARDQRRCTKTMRYAVLPERLSRRYADTDQDELHDYGNHVQYDIREAQCELYGPHTRHRVTTPHDGKRTTWI